MSIVIGYWSVGGGGEPAGDARRMLTAALARAGYARPAIVSPGDAAGSVVAACGRQAAVEAAAGEAGGASAALSVSGAGAEADVWARAGAGGLVLGRGPFGRATLFWTRAGRGVWFSSRLGPLLEAAGRAEVSLAGFYAYGCFSYVPAPLTPVGEVFAVPAGAEVVWDAAAPGEGPRTLARHEWREADEQTDDERAAAAGLRRLLEESAAAQLAHATREPVGVFLSGGLDSALTAALLVRAGARVRAYTLDFGAGCFSEVPYAEQVARALGVPLTKVAVGAARARRALGPTARRLDGLYGDGVTVPLSLLCERAAQEVGVVFNGEGGDQLFAGWTNKPIIAASVYGAAAARGAGSAGESSESSGGEAPATAESFAALYARTFHRLHGHEAGVYAEGVLRGLGRLDALAPLAAALDPGHTRGLLHRLRRANLMLKGADNIQPRAANLGASYGLDVRTLFCSLPLAEWTFGVAGGLWLREGCEKYLLKRAVEDLLPAEVVWREKRGMGVPLTQWLTGRLRRWSQRRLGPRALAAEGLWRPDAAGRILRGELSGQVQGRRVGETLWLMLMWRAWRERVLGAGRAREESAAFRLPAALSLAALGRRHT